MGEIKTFRTSLTENRETSKPPKGAKIMEEEVQTRTEEIENGFIITKTWSGRYKEKDSKEDYGKYFNIEKKWYSKTNPLTIKLEDKSLAEAFEED